MSEREKFEAAWRKEYPLHGATTFKRSGFNPDAYVNTRVQDGWLMWQARAAASAQASGQAVDKDYVSREQVIAWGKLAGFATSLQRERNLERLGDFAIFARRDRVATPPSPDAREAGGGVLTDEQRKWVMDAALILANSVSAAERQVSSKLLALLREAGSGG
ncbi:MAG TPA: hypothetical protein VF447_00100 [Terriglobales bacterium]